MAFGVKSGKIKMPKHNEKTLYFGVKNLDTKYLILINSSNTLQLNADRGWQAVNLYRGAARLIIFKVFGVKAVVGLEIVFHVR